MTAEQPTVLPWHRATATDIVFSSMPMTVSERTATIAAIIARHDPHATTLRLLGDAKEYLHDLRGEWSWKEGAGTRNTKALADLDSIIEAIRAHLAAHSKPAAHADGKKGSK